MPAAAAGASIQPAGAAVRTVAPEAERHWLKARVPAALLVAGPAGLSWWQWLALPILLLVALPLAVKLSPSFTALPHFVRALELNGVDGVVLFNRYYQPDIDVEGL